MMESKCFRIADTLLEVCGEERFLHRELMDYIVPGQSECGGVFDEKPVRIRILRGICPCSEERVIVSADIVRVAECGGGFLVSYTSPTSVSCYYMDGKKDEACIWLTGGAERADEDLMCSVRDAFFYFLQKRGKIAIHSASIIYRGKVWLFSAPAGTGKSTHVRMWREAGYPMEDFNGDITACYIDECGQPLAASMPWHGTSGIYRNEVRPLGGLLFLHRGQENSARCLTPSEAVSQMAGRCVMPAYTKEMVMRNIDMAEAIARQVPVGELNCLPDVKAAETAKRFIDKMLS